MREMVRRDQARIPAIVIDKRLAHDFLSSENGSASWEGAQQRAETHQAMHLVEHLEEVESLVVVPWKSTFGNFQSMFRRPVVIQGHDQRTDVQVVPELVGLGGVDSAPCGTILILLGLVESYPS